MKVETKIKPQVEDLKLVNKSRNPFTIIQFDSIHIVFVDKNDGPLLWDLSPEKVNVSYSKPKYCVNDDMLPFLCANKTIPVKISNRFPPSASNLSISNHTFKMF